MKSPRCFGVLRKDFSWKDQLGKRMKGSWFLGRPLVWKTYPLELTQSHLGARIHLNTQGIQDIRSVPAPP